MTDKEIKEINTISTIERTQFEDKQLPTISYSKLKVRSMTDYDHTRISVSGKTSVKAHRIFKKIKADETK